MFHGASVHGPIQSRSANPGHERPSPIHGQHRDSGYGKAAWQGPGQHNPGQVWCNTEVSSGNPIPNCSGAMALNSVSRLAALPATPIPRNSQAGIEPVGGHCADDYCRTCTTHNRYQWPGLIQRSSRRAPQHQAAFFCTDRQPSTCSAAFRRSSIALTSSGICATAWLACATGNPISTRS